MENAHYPNCLTSFPVHPGAAYHRESTAEGNSRVYTPTESGRDHLVYDHFYHRCQLDTPHCLDGQLMCSDTLPYSYSSIYAWSAVDPSLCTTDLSGGKEGGIHTCDLRFDLLPVR